MARLVFTYLVAIPMLMTIFVVTFYMVNIAGIEILIRRPYRSYFVNFTVTRILIELIAIPFLGFIVAGVLDAPTYFDKESVNKLDSLSPIFRWCLQGVAIGIPAVVLLGMRSATVAAWKENADRVSTWRR